MSRCFATVVSFVKGGGVTFVYCESNSFRITTQVKANDYSYEHLNLVLVRNTFSFNVPPFKFRRLKIELEITMLFRVFRTTINV